MIYNKKYIFILIYWIKKNNQNKYFIMIKTYNINLYTKKKKKKINF